MKSGSRRQFFLGYRPLCAQFSDAPSNLDAQLKGHDRMVDGLNTTGLHTIVCMSAGVQIAVSPSVVVEDPMQCYRATFGGRHCEIAVEPSACSGSAVAWALLVGRDGRLDPICGEGGRALREHAAQPADALAAMRQRLIALFGDEQP